MPFIPPTPPVRWPREAIIEAVRTWAQQHERPPTRYDFEQDEALPSMATVHTAFYRLANLLEAAGLDGRGARRGPRTGRQAWTRRPRP
jgi:hypothetical protein